MFGSAILVNPVLKQDATERSVYLPNAPLWYDFWTGVSMKGGQDIQAEAPLDRMPLFVRAGSILPLGPEIEYADEDSSGPIELRVYTGADGSFQLFTDEADNYDYEKGIHSIVPLKWSEADKTLTIGDRVGTFPGMPKETTFHIVWVSTNHGAGETVEGNPDRTVIYRGSSVSVREE